MQIELAPLSPKIDSLDWLDEFCKMFGCKTYEDVTKRIVIELHDGTLIKVEFWPGTKGDFLSFYRDLDSAYTGRE